MDNRVQHITIVGGGSAGWLTASIMAAMLNRRSDRDVRITVIESPNVPRIGVGEAATPTVSDTLRNLGIDEHDFLVRCDATFKTSVKFVGWNHDEAGNPKDVYHPFFAPGPQHGFLPAYHYLKARKNGFDRPYITAMTPGSVLFDEYRAPKTPDAPEYESTFRYAYHFNALLLADYLRDYATVLGVEYIADDVVDVDLDERGYVASLTLKDRGAFPVEFVVDCTGFRRLIIGEALKEPFVPFGSNLLCDRAIATTLPYDNPETDPIEPFSTSTAMSAGWVWRIPLFSRRGQGYVFSSAHISDDDAAREFMDSLGVAEPYPDLRVVPMSIGRMRRSWVKNCVAIGLAAGFFEPLESTSLHFTQTAIRCLVEFFPDRALSPALSGGYNRTLERLYGEVQDLLCMHYETATRNDTPFWRAVHEDCEIPESLATRLELWRHKLPDQHDVAGHTLFNYWTFVHILTGKGYFDDLELPLEGAVSDEDFGEFLKVIDGARAELSATLPDHRAYLAGIRETDHTPWYRPEAAALD